MMTDNPDNPAGCLKFAGLLGHEFVIVQRSEHYSAVDGWATKGEFSTLNAAKRHLEDGQRIYQKRIEGRKRVWHRVV